MRGNHAKGFGFPSRVLRAETLSAASLCAAMLLAISCAMDTGFADHEYPHLEHSEPVDIGSSSEAASVPGSWTMPADVHAIATQQRVAYEGFNGCIGNGKIRPGVRKITDYVSKHFGGISLIYRGAYCRKIAGTNSYSIHGTGRAIDIMIPPHSGWKANNTAGDRLANWLAMNAKNLGMQMIIWDRSLWKSSRGYMTGYRGKSPHVDHLHVEFTGAGADGHTSWFSNGGPHRSPFAPTGPPYAAELIKAADSNHNGVKLTGTVGQTREFAFAFKNTGHKAWDPGQIKMVISPRTNEVVPSMIRTPSWSGTRALQTIGAPVKPGATTTLGADVKLPLDHTGIRVFVALVRDAGGKRNWLIGGEGQKPVYFDIPQPLASGKLETLADTDPNKLVLEGTAEQIHSLRYAFRNTGQDTWRSGEVRLVVAPATTENVASLIQTPGWISSSVIQDLPQPTSPGEVVRFGFDIKTPTGKDGLRVFTGLNHQVAGKSKWLAGGPGQEPIFFDIDQPSWAATFEEQESMEPNGLLISGYSNEKKTVSFAFRNVGAETWQPEQVKLVLSDPTPEDVYGVQSADWLSSQEIATVENPVSPGQVADFAFSVLVPDGYDHARLNVGLVHEAESEQTWLAGGEGHTPMFFDVIHLEHSHAVVEVRGEETVAFLHEDENAPTNRIGEVSFAAGLPYEHEGISGGCAATSRKSSPPALLLGLFGLALWASRRPRHLR